MMDEMVKYYFIALSIARNTFPPMISPLDVMYIIEIIAVKF